jgi:hypothetical protein
MSTHRFLLTGLPSSGKTSYLAAFWLYANGAPQSAFGVKTYPSHTGYLDQLQQHWLEFKPVPRTPASSELSVVLQLHRKSDQRDIELTLPDLSGETIREIWTHRHWSPQFQTLLDNTAGALLFIHPQHIELGTTLQEVRELQGELPPETEVVATTPAPDPAPFDAQNVPTQIQLIDILQLMQQHGRLLQPFRLGLVISAWDTVVPQQAAAGPRVWLRQRMPALSQYLESNPHQFDYEVFGVSAQGTDYGQVTDAFQATHPYQRCRVATTNDAGSNDVTLPVQWLVR